MHYLSPAEARTKAYYDTWAYDTADEMEHMATEGEAWAMLASLWQREAYAFASSLGKGATVLSLGAGSAHDARYFESFGVTYIASDLSGHMLREAKRRGNTQRVAQMSMRQLAVRDDAVDGIWQWDSLINLPNDHLAQVFSEMARVLKPDGLGYIRSFDAAAMDQDQLLAHRQRAAADTDGKYEGHRSANRIFEKLGAAGLEIADISAILPPVDIAIIVTK